MKRNDRRTMQAPAPRRNEDGRNNAQRPQQKIGQRVWMPSSVTTNSANVIVNSTSPANATSSWPSLDNNPPVPTSILADLPQQNKPKTFASVAATKKAPPPVPPQPVKTQPSSMFANDSTSTPENIQATEPTIPKMATSGEQGGGTTQKDANFPTALRNAVGNSENEKADETIDSEYFDELGSEQLLKELANIPDEKFEKQNKEVISQFLLGFMKKEVNNVIEGKLTIHSTKYSRHKFFLLANFFILIGNNRMAGESIWAICAIELKNFAIRHFNRPMAKHGSLLKFAELLDTPNEEVFKYFLLVKSAHSDGFYEDTLDAIAVHKILVYAEEFVKLLEMRAKTLTPEESKEIRRKIWKQKIN